MNMKDFIWLIIVVLSVSILLFHVANAKETHETIQGCNEETVKPTPLPHPGPAPRTKIT